MMDQEMSFIRSNDPGHSVSVIEEFIKFLKSRKHRSYYHLRGVNLLERSLRNDLLLAMLSFVELE